MKPGKVFIGGRILASGRMPDVRHAGCAPSRHFPFRISNFPKMPSLANYLIVSGLIFSIGLSGVLLRRNILIIFMGLELMLNAANLSLVAFSRFNLGQDGSLRYNAQVLVFFIITVAAAEVAVGLAIIVALYRARQTTHVEDLDNLKF